MEASAVGSSCLLVSPRWLLQEEEGQAGDDKKKKTQLWWSLTGNLAETMTRFMGNILKHGDEKVCSGGGRAPTGGPYLVTRHATPSPPPPCPWTAPPPPRRIIPSPGMDWNGRSTPEEERGYPPLDPLPPSSPPNV